MAGSVNGASAFSGRPAAVAAVGLGSLLLFLLQPMAARALLPAFGGTPTVWAASLACYQVLLFVGYLVAHRLRSASPRVGAWAPPVLLIAAGLARLALRDVLVEGDTAWHVAATLLLRDGPVFAALAVIGPLVQSQAADRGAGDRVYGLYAVSNAASVAALLLFPTVLERWVGMARLDLAWTALLVVEVLLLAGWAVGAPSRREGAGDRESASASPREIAVWALLAAAGVAVLNGTTTSLALDIASGPLLWVAPLALYLGTWVVAFSGRRFDGEGLPVLRTGLALGLMVLALDRGTGFGIGVRLALALGALTAACSAAHGLLYARRPATGGLTGFYLAVAGGGAVGGVVSGILAPSLGARLTEIVLGFGGLAVVVAALALTGGRGRARVAAAVVLLVLVVRLDAVVRSDGDGVVFSHRDAHGLVRVEERDADDPMMRSLVLLHGRTSHGAQFVSPLLRDEPSTYFAEITGCGIAVASARALSDDRPMAMGVVGLGIGTVAAYGRAGDTMTFYELSPAVADLARGRVAMGGDRFTYLSGSPADIDVVVGDARVSMARELAADPAGRGFDLLILDAFAGDVVPVHLLTAEAFDIYRAHLSERGVMAVHVSSNWIDLRSVLYAWAADAGWRALTVSNRAGGPLDLASLATWVILFRDLDGLRALRDACVPLMNEGLIQVENRNDVDIGGLRPWTDDRGGLVDALTARVKARNPS